MKYTADLHVHSRFSRATAKNLDLEHLYISAQLKGISVVGTGDFTHPGWFAEMVEKLVPAEPGLFRLSENLARSCDEQVPAACRRSVRFILSTEISNIYKKDQRTRKNHNLILFPDFDAVRRLTAALESIGNLHSDGRPILGLDARDLLEIVLESSDSGFLVPAHIWTPWFSLLGSKSGFDSIEQCFGDLSEHIFALETGLSSDPPMNWRVSNLDGRTLISNSDAHSPQKLGREANLFDTERSFFGIRSALMSGDPKHFLGTVEFYPEEGKYHLDGHRKCGLRIHPRETKTCGGQCPVCGRPLTLGVLHRVEQLADRGEAYHPEKSHPYVHVIPLVEILADLYGVGPGTKKVLTTYKHLLKTFGSEDFILRTIESELLEKSDGIPLLGEAVRRVREKRINVLPGYDGQFGQISLFDPGERKTLLGQRTLFAMEMGKKKPRVVKTGKKTRRTGAVARTASKTRTNQPVLSQGPLPTGSSLPSLNAEQQRAADHTGGHLLIVAGPGTGKTRTLTHRVAHLISHRNVDPDRILAVTFTQKAALEMRDRLMALHDNPRSLPVVATFHSYCMQLIKEKTGDAGLRVIDDQERLEWIHRATAMEHLDLAGNGLTLAEVAHRIAFAKQQLLTVDDLTADKEQKFGLIASVYRRYRHLLAIQHLFDYEDLIANGVRILESEHPDRQMVSRRIEHVLVDEYQDLNFGQYRLVKALAANGAELFVIGDPDQAIYGFRGADVCYFDSFLNDFPQAETIRLSANYRSSQAILDASTQMMMAGSDKQESVRIYSGIKGVPTVGIIEAGSEKSEAVAVGKSIEQLLGGIGFTSMDFGQVDERTDDKAFGFADVAVLFRTARQGEVLAEVLTTAGIPNQLTTVKKHRLDSGLQAVLSAFRLLEGLGSYLDFEAVAPYLYDRLTPRDIKQLVQWGVDHDYSLPQVLDRACRLPLSGMEKSSQRKIFEWTRKLETFQRKMAKRTPAEKLESLVRALPLHDFDDWEASFRDLVAYLQATGGSAPNPLDWVSHISLQTDTDRYNHRAEKVTLLTMHAAKGLEFPVVFVTGCEDDLIPLRLPGRDENNSDEERRLFYVAMTRAKELLYLTYCRKRTIFGQSKTRLPSPYLIDIENRLKSYENLSSKHHRKKGPQQLNLF